MNRREATLHHVSNLLVGGTGLVYATTLYFTSTDDPFAAASHPLQDPSRSLHVIAAPLLVFAVGLIWRTHVMGRIRAGMRTRRKTGILLALSIAPMTASGYLLQVAVDETWRAIWVAVHLATSALWLAAYGIHFFGSRSDASPPATT